MALRIATGCRGRLKMRHLAFSCLGPPPVSIYAWWSGLNTSPSKPLLRGSTPPFATASALTCVYIYTLRLSHLGPSHDHAAPLFKDDGRGGEVESLLH